MQGSSVLLLAGTVALVAGLAGPSVAAEDPGRVAPTAEVAETGGTGASEATVPVEEADGPAAPDADEGGGDRVEPGLETEELEGSESSTEGSDKKRGSKRQDEDGSDKEALKGLGVTIKDFEYRPDPIEVSPGDEVTWTNKDTAQHSATAEGKGDFDTGLLEKGQKGTVPFNEEGTFAYICTVHPDMKGEVIVGSSGGSSGGDTSSGTGGTSSGTTFDSSSPTGTSSTDFGSSSSSTGGGSLPNTGQNELPLLLLGAALIVIGLLARAFREYWIWR